MALIHLFDGINHKTSYTFNGRLRDHIKGVDWENSVILRGGYRISPDYELQSDDVIFVRKTPGVDALIFVTAVAVVYAGARLGEELYNQRKQLNQMESALKASKATGDTTNKLPFVKGARNQAATGNSFPFILGTTLMTPYRLCPAHYTIAGERGTEQYYNVVLEVGYNNLLINKVKLGETTIKDFSGTTTPQNGSYTWDAGTYYDERNVIEIRQTGAFTDDNFNKKIVCTELSSEIPHRHAVNDPAENARIEAEWQAGVVQELPTNAKSVELIVLFDGLQKYDDGWKEQTITLQPQWTNKENPTENDWVNFTTGFIQNGTASNTFTYNTKEQMRYVATQTFTAAQAYGKTMKIRVRRTTPKAESSAKDSVYLLAVQTTCYDAKKSSVSSLVTADVLEENARDKCCRIGVRIAANLNTDGMLDAISVIASGCARTWNGTAWSQTKTPTSNLAAWELELLTTPHHAPSQYDDSELDLDTFGALYEYCEEMGFKADGVIDKSTRKKNVLDTLCKNSNSALVYNTLSGLMEVAINNGRDYSVALLNSENIVSISTVKQFKRKTDGKKVTYINGAAGYDVDSVIFMRDGGAYDPTSDTLTETALEFITSYEHAFKYAWRQMAEELAQPRIVTVKAGRESAYYPLYSRVDLQHKSLKIGLAHGVIKALVWNNSYLQKIILDGSVTFPTGTSCGVIINCVSSTGRGVLPLKVSGTGKTSELTVETTLRSNADVIPSAGNLLSFGELDSDGGFTTVTSQMLITNTEETDDGFNLTLIDYNDAIYEYGTLPTYKSNLTQRPNNSTKTISEQRDVATLGDVQATTSGAVQAAVDTVTKGYRFTNIYKVRPVESTLDEIIAKIDSDAKNSSASISMSEEEILIQVEDTAKGLRGLIDIQAGAVQALVEGGGASGQMSLSLNLPVMINAAKRAELITASSEEKVNAVYALVEGTTDYAIKSNASNSAVKALWDDAVAGGLIASQIVLSADQINLAGKTVYTATKTDSVAAAAQSAAESTAASDATSKRNEMAQKMGYASYDAMVTAASQGKTIIDGGYLRTALIQVQNLLAQNITLQANGYIQSSNYAESSGTPTAGFKIDAANNIINAVGGVFRNIDVTGTITATEGRFSAGLGEIIDLTFLGKDDPESVVTLSLEEEISNPCGLLVVCTGNEYVNTGSSMFPLWVPLSKNFTFYFYGYSSTPIGIFINNNTLFLQKIFGDRNFLSVVTPQYSSERKYLQITNRPGNTGTYERHARIFNLKIW